MTTRYPRSVIACLLVALPSLSACDRGRPEPQPRGEVSSGPVSEDRRFSGAVQILTPSGPSSVRVEITNIDIRGGHTVERLALPFEGLLLLQLQAGELTTTIDGKPEQRTQGQAWTVPPAVPLGLTTGRDAASLQSILIER
jgi:hypothetical protein